MTAIMTCQGSLAAADLKPGIVAWASVALHYRLRVGWGVAATMALLTDFETLAKLTSVGTMFVTGMVAASLLWRRYYDPTKCHAGPVLWRMLIMTACGFGEWRRVL